MKDFLRKILIIISSPLLLLLIILCIFFGSIIYFIDFIFGKLFKNYISISEELQDSEWE